MANNLSSMGLSPGTPLWKRAPSCDEQGKPLSDFMMLIPKLGKAPQLKQQQVFQSLQGVLERFHDEVVFADLNLKTSLLWVSAKPQRGLILSFAEAVRAEIPEALLIANQAEMLVRDAIQGESPKRRFRWCLPKLLR
ncbi:MAG: hypothetical protein MI754_06035 [Chromatiales bacterium]|nr:hypothetical protein [Chromatiales bacterium]